MYAEGFASKLTKARENTGFTQKEVALETNIKRSTLAGYETGRTQPDLETLGILAEFYQVSTDWLLGININSIKENKQKKEKGNYFIAARDNIFHNGDGDMYIKLTPKQIEELKETTE